MDAVKKGTVEANLVIAAGAVLGSEDGVHRQAQLVIAARACATLLSVESLKRVLEAGDREEAVGFVAGSLDGYRSHIEKWPHQRKVLAALIALAEAEQEEA